MIVISIDSIPAWAEKLMAPGGDFEFSINWFHIFTATNELKKMRSGYLLKEMLDRFTNKVESTLKPDRSLWMYFAHDVTVGTMLNSLGLFDVICFILARCRFNH